MTVCLNTSALSLPATPGENQMLETSVNNNKPAEKMNLLDLIDYSREMFSKNSTNDMQKKTYLPCRHAS